MKKLMFHRGAFVSLLILLAFFFVGLSAPWISPHEPQAVGAELKQKPLTSRDFILGTDDLGRDTLSRLIHGARVSLFVGAAVVFLALFVGVFLGLLAGYRGGWVDNLVMRGVDVLMSVPSILLAIVMVAVLGPSLFNGILAVSLVALPSYIRVVRAQVMAEKKKPYVQAAISYGAHPLRVAVAGILPNCLGPIIVQATLGFSDGILNVAALGFLGLGAQPPTPEWGTMLADAKEHMESASWLVTLPGLCILFVVISFNVLGDGLRDWLDPKDSRTPQGAYQ